MKLTCSELVDMKKLKRRAKDAGIVDESSLTYEDIYIEERYANSVWIKYVEDNKKVKRATLLDYHDIDSDDKEIDKRKQNHLANSTEQMLNQNYEFKYMTKTVGKGDKNPLTRVNVVNDDNEVIDTYLDRAKIKQHVSRFNRNHYYKAKNTPVYQNRNNIWLIDKKIENKILSGTL